MASTQGEPPDDDRDGNPSPPPPPPSEASQERPTDQQPPPSPSLRRRLANSAARNPFAVLSWLVLVVIAIPLRFAAGVDAVLTTSLLFALWFTILAAQSRVRRINRLHARPKTRTCLSVSLNAVLWTALGLIAYAYADSAISHRPLPEVLDLLQRNTTLTTLLLHHHHHPPGVPALGAGDVALAILNAGLVSWGLKLWEYRRRLASRAGATILAVSLPAALLNVALGPALARATGVSGAGGQRYDLAFAARTATLALGGPAVARLGGDPGLGAALVVANGIVFQAGLGLGVGRGLGRVTGRLRRMVVRGGEDGARGAAEEGEGCDEVAAGVTVGINAAAMGTAHLYEVRSEAAPYAALSMTVFGVATVGFTMVPQLVSWVVGRVGPAG